MKLYRIPTILSLFFCLTACNAPKPNAEESGWISLFNGKDLSGWDKFLSYQPGSENEEVLGVNNDPDNIISVVDGTIRIDGRIWGALTSKDEFENYHLKLQFKWGEKRYTPRENELRDSGLLYHCVGPHGAQSDHWMRSHECQIMEENCGDYHSLDGATIDINADTLQTEDGWQLRYSEEAPLLHEVHRRVIKSETNEKPLGDWNTIELIVNGGDITHIVNDKVVLRASSSIQQVNEEKVPLRKGKIQLQSEGAEIYYRDIMIKHLD